MTIELELLTRHLKNIKAITETMIKNYNDNTTEIDMPEKEYAKILTVDNNLEFLLKVIKK